MNHSLGNLVPLVSGLKRAHQPRFYRLTHRACALGSIAILITVVACRPQIIEVEKPVTRIVEMPVERIVTQVVERVVTRLVEPEETPSLMATQSPTSSFDSQANVAALGSVSVSDGQDSASHAIDNDLGTIWSATDFAVQWIQLTLDGYYLIHNIELVVTQAPAGETSHEIWIGDASGALLKYHEFIGVHTSDGQTLSLPVEPPLILDRVLIRTVESPSWVAWREVRVFGTQASQPQVDGPSTDTAEQSAQWPQIDLRGNLELPVQITNAGDGSGRLFIVEQMGRIRIISDGNLLPTPFLDISERVACCHEQGLLSVAFPPDYAKKQYFYVNYTNSEGNTVVARYRLTNDPNIADPESAETILGIDQPHEFHNGGHMAFGPRDGYLYIGTGDGGPPGAGGRAQDPGTLLGKILRIDVESGTTPYAIPASNPFTETAGYRDEIWALGLRNPWGFAFDPQTGDLYIGDVGEGEYEEVNYQPGSSKGGENYGWPIMEGIHCYDPDPCNSIGLTQPVVEYSHSRGCAVIGGSVYRGSKFANMRGIYFYADFCSGLIWGLRRIGDNWQSALLFDAPFLITGIGEDEEGNLYVTNYTDGTILALQQRRQVSTATPSGTATATVAPAEKTSEPDDRLAEKGRLLFVERGCVACHVVSSVPEAVGTSGPALDGFGDPSKWPLIAGVLANTPNNAKRWILNPASFKSDTAMLNMALSDSDADAIVAFLGTLQ